MLNYFISILNKIKIFFGLKKISYNNVDKKMASSFCKRYFYLENNTLNMYIRKKYTIDTIPSTNKITIIVLCKDTYISNKFINSALSYVNDSINFIFILPDKYKKLKNNKLTQITNKNNVTILFCDNNTSYACMLQAATEYYKDTKYLTIFTTNDIINPRSFLAFFDELIADIKPSVFISVKNSKSFSKKYYTSNPNIEALSGIIFKKDFILPIISAMDIRSNYWLPRLIFEKIYEDNYSLHSKRMFTTFPTDKIRINDLADFLYDTVKIINELQKKEKETYLHLFIDDLIESIRIIRMQYSLNEQIRAVLVFISAYIVHIVENQYTPHQFEFLKADFSEILNFDRDARSNRVKFIHNSIVTSFFPVQSNTIVVLESEFMEDIKHSILHDLEKKYTVNYYTMFILNDYQVFSRMLERIRIQPAKIVVASSNVPAYARGKKPFLLLWHGLGMMKVIAFSKALVPIDYLVCSSVACVEEWSNIFLTPKESILPYGNIGTDILHDKKYISTKKDEIKNKYKINSDAKVIFFAPTFRVQTDITYKKRYYNFMIDIEALSKELEKSNYYIITKLHHFLKSRNLYGEENFSGVYTSINKHFIVDDEYEAVELMAACDIFMSDYSSTIFYAAVLNKPLVLYAPDLEQYLSGFNGLMIKYPDDVPAAFVGEPDIQLLLQAFTDSIPLAQTPQYAEFRERHVGACDGKASQRVLAKIDDMMSSL